MPAQSLLEIRRGEHLQIPKAKSGVSWKTPLDIQGCEFIAPPYN
jgi:hypothetical protein